MKRIALLAGVILLVVCFAACKPGVMKGEGVVGTVAAKVGSFSAIQVELPLTVKITVQKGATPSVKFTGYANLLLNLRTKVEDKRLYISSALEDRMGMDSKGVVAQIIVPEINELYLSSGADADIHGAIAEKTFTTEVTGNSNVNIDEVDADNFAYTGSGFAHLTVKGGTVRIATYFIDEGCTVKAFPLQAKETTVTIKGAGKCEVTSLKKLNTNIAATGDVKYKGHPAVMKNPEGGTVDDAN